MVSEHARIDGEVQAAHIVVNGTINGPVHARETLELQAKLRVSKATCTTRASKSSRAPWSKGGWCTTRHRIEVKVELKLAS